MRLAVFMETDMIQMEAAPANQDGMVTSATNMNAMRLVVFMETNITPKLEAAPANQDGMVTSATKVSLKSILTLSTFGESKSLHQFIWSIFSCYGCKSVTM